MKTKSGVFMLCCSFWQGGSRSWAKKGLKQQTGLTNGRHYYNFRGVSTVRVFGRIQRTELRTHYCTSPLRAVHPSTNPGNRVSKAVGSHTMADAVVHSNDSEQVSYLSQADASAVDEILMGSLGFSIDQLMELAGLSVACAIAEVYKVQDYARILVIAGPGNNGGDGLVAARHLHHFGYSVSLCYPKRTDKPLYHGLVTQVESLSIPLVSDAELPDRLADKFDIVVDAMFGFSFKGNPRPPFDSFLQRLIVPRGSNAADLGVPILVSVDIPSGWHVEEGDIEGTGLVPDMLVSLTAPKLCAKNFKGPHHFLGGRFVPPSLRDKFSLQLPPYPGASQCVRIGKAPSVDVAALRKNYVGRVLLEDQAKSDPIEQFKEWFEDAVAANLPEANAMTLATADAQGRPSARMVLLKGYNNRGFVWYQCETDVEEICGLVAELTPENYRNAEFQITKRMLEIRYTNYGSRKAAELAQNPHAALVFYWEGLNRSVRVEGPVERVSEEESEQYFHSRPRGSQVGAIASQQSTVIQDRIILDQAYEGLLSKFPEGVMIPKPGFWGGFRLRPLKIEFWQGRTSRLHDRLIYTLSNESGSNPSWVIERQSP